MLSLCIGDEASRRGRKSHLSWPFVAGGEVHNIGDHSIKSHHKLGCSSVCAHALSVAYAGRLSVTYDVLLRRPCCTAQSCSAFTTYSQATFTGLLGALPASAAALAEEAPPIPEPAPALAYPAAAFPADRRAPLPEQMQESFYATNTAALSTAGPPPVRSSLAATTTTTAVAGSSMHGATGRPATVAAALSSTPSVARAPAAGVVAASASSAARPCACAPRSLHPSRWCSFRRRAAAWMTRCGRLSSTSRAQLPRSPCPCRRTSLLSQIASSASWQCRRWLR